LYIECLILQNEKTHKLVRPYSVPRSRLENFNRKLR